jgi:CRISPR/Cas system CSM-associated protein Csm3 (group 7 of RAMP superfamily)
MPETPDTNPYNFVPLEGHPARREGHRGFLRYDGEAYSGKLVCRLEAKTDILSLGTPKEVDRTTGATDAAGKPVQKKIRVYEFSKDARGTPILRGTSLKGMVRAVYEAITGSCLPLVKLRGEYDQPVKSIPGQAKPKFTFDYGDDLGDFDTKRCCGRSTLCPACRLFGTLAGKEEGFKGQVSFSDARFVTPSALKSCLSDDFFFLPVLGTPKPHHSQTYGAGGSMVSIAGRKFYYHHKKGKNWQAPETEALKRKDVSAVREYAPAGSSFSFDVICDGLSHQEVAELLVALELEEGLAHKIGLGKAAGLGSCVVRVDWESSNLSRTLSRYEKNKDRGLGPGPETMRGRAGLPAVEIKDELREVLRLDKEKGAVRVGYPSKDDYANAPYNQPIDALGVFGGKMNSLEGLFKPVGETVSGPSGDPPVVPKDQIAAWLKAVYADKLVFVQQDGSEITRPKKSYQAKLETLVPGRWYILSGTKSSKPS